MADINLERKERSVWPWILGLLVLAALIWGATELFDRGPRVTERVTETVTEPTVEMPATTPSPEARTTASLPVAQILASPTMYTTPVDGQARVTEVVSDRAFWLEEGGNRILAVLDQPFRGTPALSQGMMVRIEDGRVYTSSNLNQLPVQLEAEVHDLARQQTAILYVTSGNLEVVEEMQTPTRSM